MGENLLVALRFPKDSLTDTQCLDTRRKVFWGQKQKIIFNKLLILNNVTRAYSHACFPKKKNRY